MNNTNYDPMREFWRLFMPFLFKQTPLIVFMSVGVSVMWLKLGSLETQARLDRIEIRRECAQDIEEIRQDFKTCQNENDTLHKENVHLQGRVAILEGKILKSKR